MKTTLRPILIPEKYTQKSVEAIWGVHNSFKSAQPILTNTVNFIYYTDEEDKNSL